MCSIQQQKIFNKQTTERNQRIKTRLAQLVERQTFKRMLTSGGRGFEPHVGCFFLSNYIKSTII